MPITFTFWRVLKATHCLADVLRELKASLSGRIHEKIGMREFAWQEGYSAFTVSAPATRAVQRYIANQEKHHKTKTFLEELKEFLEQTGIAYDPEYLE